MLISVITPVYNASTYLPNTIRCMLSQSFTDWEWICVDDGSKDESYAILKVASKNDSRIKVIHQENGGVSKARNTALKTARGEWIAFLDADDETSTDWLKNYAESISDDIDIIFQGAEIKQNNGYDIYQLPSSVLSVTDTVFLWQDKFHHMGSAWSKCIRSSIILNNDIYFAESVNNFEDWIFLTSILSFARLCKTITKTGYVYIRPNSALTANGQKRRSAEATYAITTEWYKAMQPIKNKSFVAYKKLLEYNSTLQIQTIMETYRRKDICKKQRITLLKEFAKYDFISSKCKLSQKVTNWFFFRQCLFVSDCILRLWKFAR